MAATSSTLWTNTKASECAKKVFEAGKINFILLQPNVVKVLIVLKSLVGQIVGCAKEE